MQKKRILAKDHVIPFLRRLSKNARLIAPVRRGQGDIMYHEITSLDKHAPDFSGQPQESAKQFLMPQEEYLFSYRTANGRYEFTEIDAGMPTVLFGLRSCDISAILYMDVIFLRSPKDRYYLKRRKKTTIISIGCNEPWDNCFCNATGTGPFLEFGFDLQLTDIGDRFFVESGRAGGDAILEQWSCFFQPADQEDERLRYQTVLEARAGFRRQVHIESAFNRLKNGDYDPEIWSQLSMRCDGCGGCAYICPTCTCFTIKDRQVSSDRGWRIRSWDACTHRGFTGMAGGDNPVSPSHILKRRFMHKLHDDYLEFNRPGCVGCGRCLGICFGGVDISMFVDLICSCHRSNINKASNIIGELLMEAGLVNADDIKQAMKRKLETGMPLGRVLMEMGSVSSREIAECLAGRMKKDD